MLLIHATASDTLKSAADWLCLESSDVSTHYIIDEAGRIFQLVDDQDTAWHAGASKWKGLETFYPQTKVYSVNPASIGIELVNLNNGRDPYEQAQIDSLTWLVEWKARQYGIKRENVVRHLDVAIPKGRKSDPAGFDWAKWLDGLTFDLSAGDEWNPWGTEFPIYSDQLHFAIQQFWLKHRDELGAAKSDEIFVHNHGVNVFSFRAFENGILVYSVSGRKVFGFMSDGRAIKP